MRILFFILSLCLVSCAGLQSRYHRVTGEDSLTGIAHKYKVPIEELQKYNSSVLEKGLKPGTKLYIPFEESPYWDDDFQDNREPASSEVGSIGPIFSWPLKGYVSSGFGRRRGKDHKGIDIPARRGTPVKAARSGHIIYAGNGINGYGNLVVIRHPDSFSTVYGHLSKIDVKKGQYISRGQLLGRVGRTGHATANHLHFEVRNRQTAVNPLLFLQTQYATHIIRR